MKTFSGKCFLRISTLKRWYWVDKAVYQDDGWTWLFGIQSQQQKPT